MEQDIVFKSKLMKDIMKKDVISSKETQEEYYNIEINGENIDFNSDEYATFLEDMTAVKNAFTKNSISDISIKNIDLTEKIELSDMIADLSKIADYIRIENSKFNSIEKFFQIAFDKNFAINEKLSNKQDINKFGYDRTNKNLTIDSESVSYLNDYKQYADTKNLIIEINSQEGKQDIIDNIDILRDHREGTIFLKDVSKDKIITDLTKYENYANGKIVLFKSKIIKETMGFDRLPTDGTTGITYNLRVDGQELLEQGIYHIEGKELDEFFNDLKEISAHCPLSGISIKNISIPKRTDLTPLAETFEAVKRINIENSNIPALKEAINGMEDKSKVETISIKEAEIDLDEIDAINFPNMQSLSVERVKKETSDIQENKEFYIEVKTPWYKKTWDKLKKIAILNKIFARNAIKALPQAGTQENNKK